jgi:hypothetical protein
MKPTRIAFLILGFAVLAWLPKALLAGTLPNISGTWYAYGDSSKRCYISQSGTSVTVTNEQGNTAQGNFETNNPSRIDTDWGPLAGGQIVGTISNDLQRIDWSNGTYWIRASGSPNNPATPQPTPAPERLNVSSNVKGNESSPIYVYRVSLTNGQGRSYEQCVSFRNVSNKEATDVDFSFVVTRYSGNVEADFGHVDSGKFTPPVAIDNHCWTGKLWPDRVVRLMANETVRVKSVTFADGTTWTPGASFLRAYGNAGTALPQPILVNPASASPPP